MSEKIEAILFDLGGVFIHIDYVATINEFEKIGFNNAASLYSQSEQAELFQQYEIGSVSTAHFINKLLPLSNESISPNQVVHAWNAMIGSVEPNSVSVLKELQGKTRLFMLSNTNELHLSVVEREWNKVSTLPMNNFFENVHLSHQLGMRKPDQITFKEVCDINRLIPKNTLFIDDSIQHVIGAQNAGLQTIHLKNIFDLPEIISSIQL
jgi:HAD superfamily hydrolase (TIGR01509 family)